jgi:predicted AAA+ superfamily ATPase
MAYLKRILDNELDELQTSLSALAIEGPKAVGKTKTASRRATTVHPLDDPARLALAMADPKRLLEADPPILIDEWQRLPEVWDLVRRAVDSDATPGRYLLTGSASPDGTGTHSGAGRIASVRMRPMSLIERSGTAGSVSLRKLLEGGRPKLSGESQMRLEDYANEIVASGFPAMRNLSDRALRTQLDGYLARIVDKDFPELGHRIRNPSGLRRWMTAYAAASSTAMSFEKVRDAATDGEGEKPSNSAARPYRDALERLWILDPVPAWQPTLRHLSKLTAAPKHQLADPALAARLLGADVSSLLDGKLLGPAVPRDGSLLGALFESLVTLCVRTYAQDAEATVGHLRTFSGEHEVDLIVRRGDGRVVAIEVKLAATVTEDDVRQLRWLEERIGDELLDSLVVSTGDAAYRRPDGIGIVPAALLGP